MKLLKFILRSNHESNTNYSDFNEQRLCTQTDIRSIKLTAFFCIICVLFVVILILFVCFIPFLIELIPKHWNNLNSSKLSSFISNEINILNSIQGMWKLKERDNYEQYLHLLGVNYFSKLFVVNLKPVVEFNVFNDVWTVNVTTSLKSKTDKFKLGVEFDEEMLQIKFKTTYKLEGNKLIKQQINEQNKVITSLEITADDLLYSVAQIKNAKTTAYFERTKVNDYDQ